MPTFNNILAGSSAATDYTIDQSLRFKASNRHFERTPSSSSSRTTWTWSSWHKRSLFDAHQTIFSAAPSGHANDPQISYIVFEDHNTLRFYNYWSSAVQADLKTNALFRDPSAWLHVVLAVDTTIASPESDRIKMYVNGVQITSFANESYPAEDLQLWINHNVEHKIGEEAVRDRYDLGGYMAETHFVDGQQLEPTSFGEFKNNVWVPKEFTGTHGTNGFYLKFDSSGKAGQSGDGAGIGADHSSNNNHFTPNNFETTAISGSNFDNDIDYEDTPTKNFCTLNPLDCNVISEANVRDGALTTGTSTADNQVSLRSTHFKSSGKWYFEINHEESGTSNVQGGWSTFDNSHRFHSGNTGVHTVGLNENTVTMVAADFDNNAIWFGADGTWNNSATQAEIEAGNTANASVTSVGNYPQSPTFLDQAGSFSGSGDFNFGQRPFIHTVPSGFKTLHTGEEDAPEIKDGRDHFDVLTFSVASGATGTQTGLAFQPDLVWLKTRNNTWNHRWYDSIRGQGRFLSSNNGDQEDVGSTDGLTDFESNGFDHGDFGSQNNMVAWCWKAGGTPLADNSAQSGAMSANSVALDGTLNTASGDGAYTPAGSPSRYPKNMSINTTSRFSILRYQGTGSNLTLPHGLGAKPGFIIIKNLETDSTNWNCYHQGLPTKNPTHDVIYLNLNEQQNANNNNVFRADPDTNVFSLGTAGDVNTQDEHYIAYCWAERPGFSKMGFFPGNNDDFGSFVYTGFRPAFVLIKNPNTNGTNWVIQDSTRHPFNPANGNLQANEGDTDSNGDRGPVDFCANGFKLRGDSGDANADNQMIYVAFAENPFGGQGVPPATAH